MQIDESKYKIQKLPSLTLLHWILNPGLAVNEVLLGQRIPKIMAIDKTSDRPLMERTYIPCPSCQAMNDSRLWAKAGFGNWFGLVCPKCGAKIPCLWNLTSLIVLAITFPLWIWFKIFFEDAILKRQRDKITNTEIATLPTAKEVKWIRVGLTWGAFMFVFMSGIAIWVTYDREPDVVYGLLLKNAVICTVTGLIFGALVKYAVSRRNK